MPAPLQRFFSFAGRWPGPQAPFVNRFCMQDTLGAIAENPRVPLLQIPTEGFS
jgi:hypothetical protein